MISIIGFLFIMTAGYAAFQTNLTITAKGNIKKMTAAGQIINKGVVTEGDGLYADIYEEKRYVYKGGNPDNYITFNDEMWRILAVESDGTLKIMRVGSPVPAIPYNKIPWSSSNIKRYLNDNYYNALSEISKNQIQSHSWNVGAISDNPEDLQTIINQEKETVWDGDVATMNVSDYYKANTNASQCGDYALEFANPNGTCKSTSYIYSMISNTANGTVLTVSPVDDASNKTTWIVNSNSAKISSLDINTAIAGCLPTVYLKSDITLSGSGTSDDPYTIN